MLLLAAGTLSFCHRKETRSVKRLAVLSFENLSGDPSLDWAGPALAGMVTEQTSASLHVYPFLAADLRSARLNGATRVLTGYYSRSGDRFRINAILEDLDSRRTVKALSARAPVTGDLSATAETIASAVGDRTRPFGTQNAAAIRAWGESLEAGEPQAKIENLRRAIASDPNFGEAYGELARLYLETGDAAHAQEVLKQADDRLSQFTDLDRARVELLESDVRRNENQRRGSLVALSRLVSTDVQTIERLAQLELNARHIGPAVDLFRSAVAVEPDNPALLNQLGYAESYRGNLDGARAALERYRALQPGQPNPLDSLGEVHYFAGKFAEAASYFIDAQKMQPGYLNGIELLKAAQARFMQGDRSGADQLYNQFEKTRRDARDLLVDVHKAEWLYITGRREQAVSTAQNATRNANPDVAAYALCHLSLWAMDAGDRTAAKEFAARAAQSAQRPDVRNLAALSGYIAAGSTDSGQPVPDLARGYSSLFNKDTQGAVALLRPLFEKSSPASDAEIRTMYAWALFEAGRRNEVGPLVERYPIPMGSAGESLFMTQLFPHFLALRSATAGSTSNTRERR